MDLIKKAHHELFEGKTLRKKTLLTYSAKFKDYNANIKISAWEIIVSMSSKWKEISEDIRIGLIQVLLAKVFKSRRKTVSMELYNNFIKNIERFSSPQNFDPELKECFDRMNEKYFYGFLDRPNLMWGRESFSKLGSYEYLSDTITISPILKKKGDLLDFVMYHEMLHKKLSYKTSNNRNQFHTSEFRKKEKEFHVKDIEKKLQSFVRKKRLSKALKFF